MQQHYSTSSDETSPQDTSKRRRLANALLEQAQKQLKGERESKHGMWRGLRNE